MHKYLLEQHSDFFRRSFSDDSDGIGSTEDRPISLHSDVTPEAFDCLLSFLYTGYAAYTLVS